MNPSFEKSHITTVAINATGKVSWDQEDETLYVDFSQKVLNELYNADPSSYQGKLLSFGRVELSSDHLHLNGQSVSVTFTDITKSENYQVAYWYALAESEQFPATKVLIGAKVKKDAEAEDSPSPSLQWLAPVIATAALMYALLITLYRFSQSVPFNWTTYTQLPLTFLGCIIVYTFYRSSTPFTLTATAFTACCAILV